MGWDFASDNVRGACPEVARALAELAGGAAPYGADELTARLETRLAELFEHPVAALPVATGTAANALAVAAFTPPHGSVYCHHEAHILRDEAGACEFFAGGARLIGLPGENAKLTPETLDTHLDRCAAGNVHRVRPRLVSITQSTELGTLYTPGEVAAIGAWCQANGLALHMDGARFANAVAALGVSPAELTWKAGVDVLSLGGTKNGAWAAEALVLFDPERAEATAIRRKRGGHLLSKGRFLAAQLLALFEDGTWLANGRHANTQATRLAEGLLTLPGVRPITPTQANEVFLHLPEPLRQGLNEAGFGFTPWGDAGPDAIRLVTA
ncbi:threonine aldolase family protein [Roseospirillum parvum]|uniref:L-threonine aldolase n=1 Tax=Roseospirillum parvum TaxID=83401 RepID=A0A1G8FHI9_9PROT|nr:beta-eliminating lyase-related protein [Roseospirillum parvum]SDH81459.1 L-threonine aldolase [Roseospirillum parvum]